VRASLLHHTNHRPQEALAWCKTQSRGTLALVETGNGRRWQQHWLRY